MDLKIYLNSLFIALIIFDSHVRISGIPRVKKYDPPTILSKINSTKITNMTWNNNKVFTVRMSSDGNSNIKCECVSFRECNGQNLYNPMANESYIDCGAQQACCILPQNSKVPASFILNQSTILSSTNTPGVCVTPNRCDRNGISVFYGELKIIPKNIFSGCRRGELRCPADKILPNSKDKDSITSSNPYDLKDCTCIPITRCPAVSGVGVITPRIGRCNGSEICCPNTSKNIGSKTGMTTVAPYDLDDCTCVPLPRCSAEFGAGVLEPKMGRCNGGEICCPNKNVVSKNNIITATPHNLDDCICTPLTRCTAEFGANVLVPKMSQCVGSEICCPKQNVVSTNSIITLTPHDFDDCICTPFTRCTAEFGADVLIPKMSQCVWSEICCPKKNVVSKNNIITLTPHDFDDCTCTPLTRCTAEFGADVLVPKMSQCVGGEICCPNKNIISVTDLTTVAPPSNVQCGIKKKVMSPRFLDGTETNFGEFPWMVLILERINNEEKVLCGASMILTNLVLTAAHCVYHKNMDSLIIRAGEYDLTSASEEVPHQDRFVEKILIHPNYMKEILIHDLAFVVIRWHFNYATNVAPICLPLTQSPYSPVNMDMYDFDHCIATGWGAKSANEKSVRNILSKIDLKLMPSDQCLAILRKSPLGPRFILHPSFICAIGAPGTDTCKGDGGGPLICPLKKKPNTYVQVGVIAGGLNCTGPYPGLYASLLDSNSNWISEQILLSYVFIN